MRTKNKPLDQYASKWVLTLSGSLLVLSVAFNNVGIGKILDAYAQSIINDIKSDINPKVNIVEKKIKKIANDLIDQGVSKKDASRLAKRIFNARINVKNQDRLYDKIKESRDKL